MQEPNFNLESVDKSLAIKTASSNDLEKGMIVQVSYNGERFWATVTKVKNNFFVGRIDNHLIYNHGFNYGDCVKFSYRRIVDVKTKQEMTESALAFIRANFGKFKK